MIRAIWIVPKDNVATVTEPAACGQSVFCSCGDRELTVSALSEIPQYHKIALCSIPCGAPIYKYGEVIGFAREIIPTGAHVHTHNTASSAEEVQLL